MKTDMPHIPIRLSAFMILHLFIRHSVSCHRETGRTNMGRSGRANYFFFFFFISSDLSDCFSSFASADLTQDLHGSRPLSSTSVSVPV